MVVPVTTTAPAATAAVPDGPATAVGTAAVPGGSSGIAPRPGRLRRSARRTIRSLHRLRASRFGLRARITVAFGLGAFGLSVLLAGTTYVVTRSTLLRQREDAVLPQAAANARVVRDALRVPDPNVSTLLPSLPTPTGASPLIAFGGRWYSLRIDYGEEAVPQTLRRAVLEEGLPAKMIVTEADTKVLMVGLPLPEVDAAYFEIVPLDELDQTLRSLGITLTTAAAVSTLLGVMTGRFVSARAVRPLADAARAAEAIAGGRLDTRLEPGDDPDLRLLATSFNDMVGALAVRVERDARFASDVSHELRSPLMTLSASVEVLQGRREELGERSRQALDLLAADLSRFQQLVEDLLEISRFDAGSVRLQLDEVIVSEFVRQAVAVAGYADVPVRVAADAAAAVIRADKRRLARVVANLLDNARNHGGGAVEVVVERAEADTGDDQRPDTVWIAVEDAGPGVAPEDRGRIFQRFNRGGSAGRRGLGEGVGLGLALVEEHVKLHRGRVWVESRRPVLVAAEGPDPSDTPDGAAPTAGAEPPAPGPAPAPGPEGQRWATPPGARFVLELPVVAW